MSSMGELTFFLGLQVMQRDDGIFISQDKYVADILKKFDFSSVKTTSTPIETNKVLLKDKEAEDVDVHLYRSMIGSLMYLTASRLDIMFAVYACARFQVTPKVSHLYAMKRIFRYLTRIKYWALGFGAARQKLVMLSQRTVTPLFASTLVPQVVEGEGLGQPSEPQRPSSIASPAHEEQVTIVASQPKDHHTREDDRVVRAATTATSLEAEQESGNIHKTRSTATLHETFSSGNGQVVELRGPRYHIGGCRASDLDFVTPTPQSSPLAGGHTPGSDKGRTT
ncbi:putative ribonuclease H-like domain-containing protein [Tanacetum coccineum]|uniref:Ribonuclease H-like domain-containing protein n=1 Tax=Tanacetum coccineum TaxID=301880 RepID=A0ABQ5B719_9ASTR